MQVGGGGGGREAKIKLHLHHATCFQIKSLVLDLVLGGKSCEPFTPYMELHSGKAVVSPVVRMPFLA